MTPLVQLCPVAAQQERKKKGGLFQLGEQLEIIKKKKRFVSARHTASVNGESEAGRTKIFIVQPEIG